jgi:hypothetical protein
MSKIVLAGKYATIHTKNWAVPPKKPKPGREQRVRGHVKMRRDFATEKMMPLPVNTFDRADEMIVGMKQATDKMLDKFRYPDQQNMAQADKRYTNGVESWVLVRRILRMNSNLFVEDSYNVPGCAGFYKMVGGTKVAAGYPNASFRHGYMPEATITIENKERLATEFIFGWRQVLIRLLRSGDLLAWQFKKLWGVTDCGDERARGWANDLGELRA